MYSGMFDDVTSAVSFNVIFIIVLSLRAEDCRWRQRCGRGGAAARQRPVQLRPFRGNHARALSPSGSAARSL